MADKKRQKVAVVLFNLGGPDNLEAVQPFLFNLFNDPAIISLPNPFRWLIAKLISSRRAPVAQKIYEQLGGKSPLLEGTKAQADALEALLQDDIEAKCFIAMRYWHPLTDATVGEVKAWGPDRILLLPLYPQFSSTTTGSSLKAWAESAARAGLTAPVKTICCYPDDKAFAAAHAEVIAQAIKTLPDKHYRILFSAHGLPKKVIEKGDPYQLQVEMTVHAVIAALKEWIPYGNAPDYAVCYQSRVGPMEWIGPSTEREVKRAANDGRSIIIAPIAFVSEHSETLVELDIEYRHLAVEAGARHYIRVPALGVQERFIQMLANRVKAALQDQVKIGEACLRLGHTCPALKLV